MTQSPENIFSVIEKEAPPQKFALIMGGQGNIDKEAGLYEYQASDIFAESFDRSDTFYAKLFPGFSLKRLCFSDSDSDPLSETRNTHRAITALYIAKYAMLRDQNPNHPLPQLIAGQSAGEIAAFSIAGVFDQETALYIADKRGEFTAEAGRKNSGVMTSFLYRKDNEGEEDLKRAIEIVNPEGKRGVLSVSNFNSPREYVVSGQKELVEELEKTANPYKLARLDISFASHCDLVKEAEDKMADLVEGIPFYRSKFRIVSNGEILTDPSQLKSQLARGITRPSDWLSSVRVILEEGINGLIELSSHPQNKAPLSKFAGRVSSQITPYVV